MEATFFLKKVAEKTAETHFIFNTIVEKSCSFRVNTEGICMLYRWTEFHKILFWRSLDKFFKPSQIL
jgi:hypothetical protein